MVGNLVAVLAIATEPIERRTEFTLIEANEPPVIDRGKSGGVAKLSGLWSELRSLGTLFLGLVAELCLGLVILGEDAPFVIRVVRGREPCHPGALLRFGWHGDVLPFGDVARIGRLGSVQAKRDKQKTSVQYGAMHRRLTTKLTDRRALTCRSSKTPRHNSQAQTAVRCSALVRRRAQSSTTSPAQSLRVSLEGRSCHSAKN